MNSSGLSPKRDNNGIPGWVAPYGDDVRDGEGIVRVDAVRAG